MNLHDLEAAVRTALDSADISPVDARVARFPDAPDDWTYAVYELATVGPLDVAVWVRKQCKTGLNIQLNTLVFS